MILGRSLACPFKIVQIRSSHPSLIYSCCGRFQITFSPPAIIRCYPELHLSHGQIQSRSPTEILAETGKSGMIASFHPHSGVSHTAGVFRLMQIIDPLSALSSGQIKADHYPFNHKLYLISTDLNIKSCENVC